MEEITINVVVADRSYPITIERKEEEYIRQAVKDINDKIKDYAKIYAFKDKQDLLAMAALQISTENTGSKNSLGNLNRNIQKEVEGLEVLIDRYLDK